MDLPGLMKPRWWNAQEERSRWKGSPRNIKITTPDDLELAEFFLKR